MNNQQPQNPYGALLGYLMGGGANTAKNAQDILRGTGLQGTYDTQVATGNAATQAGQKVTDAALGGPVNGSYVNAAPMQDVQNQAMIKDSSMPVNLLLGIINQASGLTQNANNNMTTAAGNAANAANTQRGLSGQETLNGETYNPNTNTVGFGGSSNNGAQTYSPQAIQSLKTQGAKDLFPDGMSTPQQMQVYSEIQKAGGLSNFRKQYPQSLSKDDSEVLGATNDTLQKVNFLQSQLSKSKALKAALDTPGLTQMLQMGNKWIDQYMLGLTPQDMQAVAYMSQLNATNDRAQVGGRLDNYLLQRLGGSGVGIHNNVKTNQEMLSEIKNHIISNNLTPLAKGYGYNSVYDLPYVQFGAPGGKQPNGAVNLIGPDGKTYSVDQSEAGQALKNGWKESQ